MSGQTKARVSSGKAKGIDACADSSGVIRAAAMDQRGSLRKEIGKQGGQPTGESLTEFKTAVTRALTPHATAILMDPEYGLPALKAKAPGTGVLLAYEKTGYDADPANRMPDLLEALERSAAGRGRRRRDQGAPLLRPVRRAGRQRPQARVPGAHRRGVHGMRRPVLPRAARL